MLGVNVRCPCVHRPCLAARPVEPSGCHCQRPPGAALWSKSPLPSPTCSPNWDQWQSAVTGAWPASLPLPFSSSSRQPQEGLVDLILKLPSLLRSACCESAAGKVWCDQREMVRAGSFRRAFNRLREAKENCIQEFLSHFKYNIDDICTRLPVKKKDNINKHFQETLGTSASLPWMIQYRGAVGPGSRAPLPPPSPTIPCYAQEHYTELKKSHSVLSFRQRADSESVQTQKTSDSGPLTTWGRPHEKEKKGNTTQTQTLATLNDFSKKLMAHDKK